MESVKLSLEELNRVDVQTYKNMAKVPLVVILDDIRSALNVGSIFRTSDCFAIEKVFLCGITATPPHREIFKTAIGATEAVEWEYVESVEDAIKGLENTTVLAVEQTKNSVTIDQLEEIHTHEKLAVVLGNEVNGVSDLAIGLSDYCLEIQQYGTKHSLNVAVCGGIVLWKLSEWLRHKL